MSERLDPTGLTVERELVRVRFRDGEHADFHPRWLRHRCDRDVHPTTGERTVCSSELPDDLAAHAAHVDDDTLHVRWSHGERESRYSGRFLRAHAYAVGLRQPPHAARADGLPRCPPAARRLFDPRE